MTKYRTLFFLIFTLLSATLYSQKKERYVKINKVVRLNKKLTYGYYLGLNIYDFLIKYKEYNPEGSIRVSSRIGFNVGLIGDMKMGNHFSLRIEPGLSRARRTLIFPFLGRDDERIRNISSDYVRLPILIKYMGQRHNNYKPYVISGVSVATNFAADENSEGDNQTGKFRMTTYSTNYEIGGGFEFYFYYFKLTLGFRGVFGITNELVPDKDPNSRWTSNIGSIWTRGFLFNIKIQ